MALSKSIPSGPDLAATYHAIFDIAWDKLSKIQTISVNSFVSQANREACGTPIFQFPFAASAQQPLTLSGCYDYLKTTDVFQGASDA